MELFFKGKEFVYNHHLTIPFRPLIPHVDKSIGDGNMDENLIIHGDNLHALKALLPRYAGKVDCIFIDPPYNTGNENWCYNDNVNSPIMREWLSSNPVNGEDLLRHDKWCSMIWPRLRLLHDLLSEDGLIFVSLDDNEQHHAIMIFDEIFGDTNKIANISWIKRYTRSNNAKLFYSMKDHLIVYRRSENVLHIKEPRTESADSGYTNPDGDPKGPWITSSYVNPAQKEKRKNLVYSIVRPIDGSTVEHPSHAWKYSREEHARHVEENRLWWGQDGKAEYPRLKLYLSEANQMVPVDVWNWSEVGSSDDGGNTLKDIFGGEVFDNPKPVGLVEKALSLIHRKDALILDSFAGSGTTAHAVLETNRKDGGNRRFILVECEDYADTLTAERVRRVMNGYSFSGKDREELFREKLTWTKFKKASDLLHKVSGLEALHAPNFDRIKKEIKDGELIVTGEKDITETKPGLGGSFTFCTLGEAVDMDALLTGASLPDYAALGAWVFYTATNQTLPTHAIDPTNFYLGESSQYHVWLIYKPDLDFLKSNDSALTLSRAENIARTHRDKRHLVFAPVKFVPNKTLLPLGIEFAQLPYAIYRREQA